MTDCEKVEQVVYISCVEEVRYSFVSHLSEAIRRKGINDVFVDSDDQFSKEAQAVVERARVSVMVLPGNHEPTTTCLGKLVLVLKCERNDDQVVIPVLYGVRTLDVEWRRVLQNMSGLAPFHQSRKGCSDSKLVKEIVRDVYEKLFYVERIGIYSKLLELENMVCKQPLGIRSVGIWGMPGIGKTTLAKAFFDQMSAQFDAYCFIEDCDKVIHEKGLYRLLGEQFLKEKTGATTSKLSLLRKKLNNKRVLVVLDDVRNHLVAESFLGGFDWFAPESLIIITSRDKQVFCLCRVNQIYEVQGLNKEEALQLFLLFASIECMDEQNHHELAMKVIEHANGNPLALTIYGRELKGKTELSEMQNAFLKLKRRPPLEIVDVVRSSYETLSDTEKNIFLDIACFFRGENVDYVMQLLEGCDFFPHVGVDVLVDKCLVTISENLLQMHNMIQDAGREIINGEPIRIERRTRLWEPWSIKYLLEDNEHKTTFNRAQGTDDTEGIFLDTSSLGFNVKHAAFENMLNLRLLKIYSSNSEIHPVFSFPKGFLRSLPKELRLLHWENYPLQCLPQDFDPMHLIEVNMPYSQLQTLWGGTKNLEMLRTIRLCHSQQLVDIDDLVNAQNLEVIDLQGCTRLQIFPATGQLLHLRVVNLSGCTEIKSFQAVSPNIEILHLNGTGIIELPLSTVKPTRRELVNLLSTEIPGLSGLSNLEYSDLERLTSGLMKVSSSTQDLRKLICLELKDCSRLRSLPNMANWECLKVLDLSGCSQVETIQGFPPNLKELYIACTAVREVPQLPQSLELMYAHGCASLKSICFDSENLHMHYTFSNCFNLSPQVVYDFLVKVLGNVKHIPREHPQELNEAPAFSFCAPSHATQDTKLDLQLGSSVMTRLNPSWRSTLVGFVMLVEVAFSEDYDYDANGFGVSCVCRWKDEKGHSHKIERNLQCWNPGKAVPKVQKDHMFFFCDVKMRPSTNEGNDPNIVADLVVFEFFPVKQNNRLDDTCTVTRCGVYAITGNTDLKMSSPVLSEFADNKTEEVWRVSYDGLHEIDKALFLYIVCLFSDEDVNLVVPLISSTDVDISSGLKVLASRSLIRVSSNGEIVMHSLLRKMGEEILHRQSILPGSSEELTKDFEKDSMGSSSSPNWKHDVYPTFSRQDIGEAFLNHLLVAFKRKSISTFKDKEMDRDKLSSPLLVQAIRESRISIVVFSKRYASSSWLLNELVEIAKCRRELGQKVIPIYYGVDPTDVRKQTGEFGRHFKQTSKRKTEDEKHQWERALSDISMIAGYHSSTWDNEAQMIEKISSDVSNILNCTPSADFDGFVEINAHIRKMIPLLRLESEEARMVGIWGPSGIGGEKLSSKTNGGSKRELLLPRDGLGQIAAHTFAFRELAAATMNFHPDTFLGEGGFGRVYKGRLDSTGQVVAVKQLDRNGLQGNREFLVEVLMLSLLHHPNLVNLIGYCADGDQRLLVYEFMPLGSLEDHLHDLPPDKEALDWNMRMKIAAGAAKGLEFLHDKANPPVIYRDFKSSNILLDEGFHPKLSDFGLAKLGPTGDKSHVSTRVMGTYGYCAPEYAMTGQLTVKSDVYSFGVVFLELITGRKAIDSEMPHGEQNLVAWARPLFNDRRKFIKLADPKLKGRFPTRALYQALAVASMCIQEQAATRPLIADVVTALSYLANQAYDPNKDDSRRNRDERGGRLITRNDEGGGSGSKFDLEGSEKEDSPRETTRILNRDINRERAVAEAKMWGESLREKRRQSEQGTSESNSTG